jgi:hypothetical protein
MTPAGTADTYLAREPSLVWTLADLGILNRDVAERNGEQWDHEIEHLNDLWRQADAAWRELPWRTRLRLSFSISDSPVSWKIRWRQEHDPWNL